MIRMALQSLLVLAFVASGIHAETITGQVVRISDGDTITVMSGGQPIKVRLYGIDAPEDGQDFGRRAKDFASDLAFKRTVQIEVTSGRIDFRL